MLYSTLTPEERQVIVLVQRMVDQIAHHHPRAEHIRADLNAYVSECALTPDGTPRGTLLTVLFWRFPHYIDIRPVADALGVVPSSLRTALDLDGVK